MYPPVLNEGVQLQTVYLYLPLPAIFIIIAKLLSCHVMLDFISSDQSLSNNPDLNAKGFKTWWDAMQQIVYKTGLILIVIF